MWDRRKRSHVPYVCMNGDNAMRFTLVLALLLSPLTAFAQNQTPPGPIPVHKCVQTAVGATCGPVRDGSGFAASNGYTRANRWGGSAPSQQAMTGQQGDAEPFITR